jgi:hypothetical protein
MIQKVFDRFLEYLATHPDVIISIQLWTVTMIGVYFILIKYRVKMIDGASGEDHKFQIPEQISYVINWIFPGIICFGAFFKADIPDMIMYTLIGALAYSMGGTWLFKWLLALRAGKSEVEETKVTLKEEVKITTNATSETGK